MAGVVGEAVEAEEDVLGSIEDKGGALGVFGWGALFDGVEGGGY
jgi:hypothetical protein